MGLEYDYRNCQSLFGYAQKVHERSGGICQLCGAGAGANVDFDFWRQLTVEHLIGNSQGGYCGDVLVALANRFPNLSESVRKDLARRIDEANTVTACSFCNSTTSRDKADKGMSRLISEAAGDPAEVVGSVIKSLGEILEQKRGRVAWKLTSVRKAFENLVELQLNAERAKKR